MWQQTDQQIVENQTSKIDKQIWDKQAKMDAELTGDEAVDSVITTPQDSRSPYQIAVANLNPELKSKNKKYQSALNARNILENEKVNLWQAWELMMNAYKSAIEETKNAAQWMMSANAANAALQAWAMIAWSAWLSANPAAAAQTRSWAQNALIAQNAQIRSNADQNIANMYANMSQIPWTISSIAANNAQMDVNRMQADANSRLTDAQIRQYDRQTSTGWWWFTSRSSSTTSWAGAKSWYTAEDFAWLSETTDKDWIRQIVDSNWKLVDPDLAEAYMNYIDENVKAMQQK